MTSGCFRGTSVLSHGETKNECSVVSRRRGDPDRRSMPMMSREHEQSHQGRLYPPTANEKTTVWPDFMKKVGRASGLNSGYSLNAREESHALNIRYLEYLDILETPTSSSTGKSLKYLKIPTLEQVEYLPKPAVQWLVSLEGPVLFRTHFSGSNTTDCDTSSPVPRLHVWHGSECSG